MSTKIPNGDLIRIDVQPQKNVIKNQQGTDLLGHIYRYIPDPTRFEFALIGFQNWWKGPDDSNSFGECCNKIATIALAVKVLWEFSQGNFRSTVVWGFAFHTASGQCNNSLKKDLEELRTENRLTKEDNKRHRDFLQNVSKRIGKNLTMNEALTKLQQQSNQVHTNNNARQDKSIDRLDIIAEKLEQFEERLSEKTL